MFPNLAGPHSEDKDAAIAAELRCAGVDVKVHDFLAHHSEVRTRVLGTCGPWSFERAWRYWVAKGPGIPPEFADKLHEQHGDVVRVDGHCGCPSPREWFKGFAVGHYHVDTAEGLKALAETIKAVMA